jgi:ubiquinone/menaquinone biosynthesis C-methylase UbiE
MSTSAVPPYETLLASYHRAFSREIRVMLEDLPICAGDRVLDLGCGDGFYTRWLAPLAAPDGEVIGVDLLPSYLELARQEARQSPHAKIIRFQQGNVKRLPFRSGAFDVVWCAQSLFSFPDPLQALKEMSRVTRSGGVVAILENDTLHQVLLPWDVQDELALRQAEWRALQKTKRDAQRFYIARNLRSLFEKAGLRPQRRRTYASHREFPVGSKEHRFLDAYLLDLRDRTAPYVDRMHRGRLHRLLTPGDPAYLVDEPHFSVTCLDHVMWGKKP